MFDVKLSTTWYNGITMTNTKSIHQSAPASISTAFQHVLDLVDRLVVPAPDAGPSGGARGQVRYMVRTSERVDQCNSANGELEAEGGHIRGCWLVLEPGEEYPREVME